MDENVNEDFHIDIHIYPHVTYIKPSNPDNKLVSKLLKVKMKQYLGVKSETAYRSRAYQEGHWDGLTHFYDFDNHCFSTGLLPEALKGIRSMQAMDERINYEMIDERNPPLIKDDEIDEEIELLDDKDPSKSLTLFQYQQEAVEAALKKRTGIVDVATNGGKTAIACAIIQQLIRDVPAGKKILFLVPSVDIFTKSLPEIKAHLGLSDNFIGVLGDGKDTSQGKAIVIATVDTIHSRLQKPDKGVKYNKKNEQVIKYMSEVVAKKYADTTNPKTLLRAFIKNTDFNSRPKQEVLNIITDMAYNKEHSNAKIKLALKSYQQQFYKLQEKKAGKKFKRWEEVQNLLKETEVLIVDEAHHTGAKTHFEVMNNIPAPYRIGLTGTADLEDKEARWRLTGAFNRVIYKVPNELLIDMGVSAKPTIKFLNVTEPRRVIVQDNKGRDKYVPSTSVKHWLTVYKTLVTQNQPRNKLIAQLTDFHYTKKEDDSILIIVNQTTHAEKICEELEERGVPYEFIKGKNNSDERTEALTRVRNMENRVLVATGILDEGVSVNAVNVLIYAAGLKSSRQVLQRVGRVLRKKDDNKATIYDFHDKTNPMLLKHSKSRQKIYEAENFTVKHLNN